MKVRMGLFYRPGLFFSQCSSAICFSTSFQPVSDVEQFLSPAQKEKPGPAKEPSGESSGTSSPGFTPGACRGYPGGSG